MFKVLFCAFPREDVTFYFPPLGFPGDFPAGLGAWIGMLGHKGIVDRYEERLGNRHW